MFRIFAYLHRHPDSGIFYFRLTVPPHLRQNIGKREIKKSLGTGLKSEAIPKAQRLHIQACELFQRLEKRMAPKQPKPSDSFTPAEVLAALDAIPTAPDGSISKTVITVAGQKVTIERDDPLEEARIAAELLKLAPSSPAPAAPKGASKKDASITLSKMVSLYFDEIKRAGTQTEKSIESSQSIFQLLQEVLKNPSVETIGFKSASEFKSVLLRLPPNRTKGKYAGKSVSEILRMRPTETMSIASVNKYVRRASTLFDWGKRHGFVHENPFGGLSIRQKVKPHQQRDRFEIEELAKLFDPANLHRDMRQSYMFWLPWMGLYTGARLNELCQLHLDDIRQECGVWVFDINTKHKDKGVKADTTERLVPIHPKLVELGLLEHVEALRKRGEKRLFPELDRRRDGYGQTASKWFARYRQRLGVGKTFHSLRHTVADELKQRGADYKKVAALLGHVDESMTFGRYAQPYRPDVLLPVVEMLDFKI